jgi:DNA-binding HxlR family transcriptional regulator
VLHFLWLKIAYRYTLCLVPGTKWIPGYLRPVGAKRIASMCPIEELLVLIGGRWKPVILWWLLSSEEPLRFKGLRQRMPRISQKVLTQQLRELERDGLVRREMFAEMPVRVEYTSTSFGRKLRPVLRVLDSWARKHVMEAKRAISKAF